MSIVGKTSRPPRPPRPPRPQEEIPNLIPFFGNFKCEQFMNYLIHDVLPGTTQFLTHDQYLKSQKTSSVSNKRFPMVEPLKMEASYPTIYPIFIT